MTTEVASDSVTVVGRDAARRPVTRSGPSGTHAFSYPAATWIDQFIDRFGNSVYQVRSADGLLSVISDQAGKSAWSEAFAVDAAGKVVLQGVDWESSSINAFATDLGIPVAFPDWLQVQFNGPKQISAVKVYSLQDAYTTPAEPTPEMRFSLYGLSDFEVQYWVDTPTVKKWVVVPDGVVVSNRNVLRRITFPPVTTTRVRVVVKHALGHYSRIPELEVFDTGSVNVALAQNGGVATASSTHSAGFAAAYAINGDRKGSVWGTNGGWNDATPDTVKLGATTVNETSDAFNRTITTQSPIAKVTRTVNLQPPPATRPQPGYPFIHGAEQTEVRGKILRAQLVETSRGKEIWDNQGGSQWYGHDYANRMLWVADANDYVVKIVRDSAGRVFRLYLGETAAIEFLYDAQGLRSKEFIDLRTSTSLYRVTRPSAAEKPQYPRTRQLLEAVLPGHGPVAEFDKTVSDSGLVLASLFDRPYALIPFNHTGPIYNWHMPVRWIITLYPEDAIHDLVDRVEYNDDEIIVRMGTWREYPGTARHTVAFSLPRYWSSAKPATFKEDTSQTPAVANMFVAFSDGGAENHEPDNDDVGCHTDECITVTAPAPKLPPLPSPPSYPPVNGGGGGGTGGQLDPFNRSSLQGLALARTETARREAEEKLTNKPECAALFQTLVNPPGVDPVVDPSWQNAMRRVTNITSGNGIRNNLRYTPCTGPETLMWMRQPKAGTVYVCPKVGEPGTSQWEVTNGFIHELLHAAGLREKRTSSDPTADLTHGQITEKVNAACN